MKRYFVHFVLRHKQDVHKHIHDNVITTPIPDCNFNEFIRQYIDERNDNPRGFEVSDYSVTIVGYQIR